MSVECPVKSMTTSSRSAGAMSSEPLRVTGLKGTFKGMATGLVRKPPSLPMTRHLLRTLVNLSSITIHHRFGALPGIRRVGGHQRRRVQGDAVRGVAVRLVELQVQKPGVAGIQEAQPVRAGFHRDRGIDRAVGQHGVAEELRNHRRVGRRRDLPPLDESPPVRGRKHGRTRGTPWTGHPPRATVGQVGSSSRDGGCCSQRPCPGRRGGAQPPAAAQDAGFDILRETAIGFSGDWPAVPDWLRTYPG